MVGVWLPVPPDYPERLKVQLIDAVEPFEFPHQPLKRAAKSPWSRPWNVVSATRDAPRSSPRSGPATQTREAIETLIDAGMNVARLNFSHRRFRVAPRANQAPPRSRRASATRHSGILLDCPGPKLRIGKIPDGPIELRTGDSFRLVTDDVPGSREHVSVSYPTLPDEVLPGDKIFLGDGDVELEVERTEPGTVHCCIVSGGPLSSRKGMNFPTRSLSVPQPLPTAIVEGIALAIDAGVDFIALSFVRTAEDVRNARAVVLAEHGATVPLIAKIEKHEALDNLEVDP